MAFEYQTIQQWDNFRPFEYQTSQIQIPTVQYFSEGIKGLDES